MRESNSTFNYIEQVFTAIYKNIIVASEKGNEESFNELLDFLFYKLLTGSFGFSISTYEKSTSLLINLYQSELQQKHKKYLIERAVESLTTKISLGSKYGDDKDDFVSISYSTFLNLLKIILEEDNYEIFNRAFEKNDELLFKIDSSQNKQNNFFKFSTIIICWIYFLKFQNRLSYEKYRFDFIESDFLQLTNDIESNFIYNFFELFDDVEKGFWHVSSWEIAKPPVNKAYFSLMPNQWMPFGLTMILLRHNHLTRYVDYNKIEPNRRFRFLFDDIKKILDSITNDSQEYIDFIFPNPINSKDLIEQLNYKKENVLDIFRALKKTAEIDHYKKIQAIPLSEIKIEEFRNKVGNRWQDNTVIINLLKDFEKVRYLENVESRDGFGFFQTLLKGKFAFIEGEFYQEIYGLDNYGIELARNLDNSFFNSVHELFSETSGVDLKSYLEECISKKDNIDKTVIFGNWRVNDLLGIKYGNRSNSISEVAFKNVPVVNHYSNKKDYVYLIDFEDVEIDIFTSKSPKWFNNQLLVDVTEYSKGEIGDDDIKTWNEKDGLKYTSGDVEILESNNVDIKILFKGEYKFKDGFNATIIKLQ